jgi:hypothetical protein
MSSRMALIFPVLPGKDAKDIANELKSRPREYEESRKRLGVTMERAYLQHTPMGDFIVGYIEAEGNPLETLPRAAQSDLDIDRFFTKAVKEIHGADLTKPMEGPPPEPAAEWIDSTVSKRGRGLGFCFPVEAGKTEQLKSLLRETYAHDEFARTRRELKQNAVVATISHTPMGDIAGVYIEAVDPQQTLERFAASDDPFNVRFLERLASLLGPRFDIRQPVDSSEEVFDSTKVADLSMPKAA